jgi:bud emergence protein 1
MHPRGIDRQPSPLTQASQNPNGAAPTPSPAGAQDQRVFQDDLIAIRVPNDISFQQLKEVERPAQGGGRHHTSYNDEPSNSRAELLSDYDLDVAIQRNPKLQLLLDTLKLTNDCGQQLIVFPSSLLLDLHVSI